MSDADLLPGRIQDELANIFADAVAEIAEETGIPDAAIDITANELALALSEARKDLIIMVTRRMKVEQDFHGLSVGKLAGILVFRLSRYRIVQISEDGLRDCDQRTIKIASKLQELAALRFASEAILKVHPQNWHPELLYILSRRHINQEMLGVTFDVIATHSPPLKTISPLDAPPFNKFYRRRQNSG
ncbi:hypothetical protein [Azospirillum rugosum]|uniref:Uncharacterized protein n=1 Tax=Azospirillum rugosum TaxID=416170 RepID=A0ABS4SV10_9PROT|nr:hypothetical protein [Azospirillum rugosum]MBP2295792.1 hypothetical protein [Azospirillum rugosum]MDQ0529097.1 hypothetical protein [Azospirillum rugosum]